ncbi:unnamed protein product [Rangifer tarandus platyrhynchus]|uniref:Uncharacterized protein n=1 Tax=Rangifer tarandus platyrhynchus TaxID=3082113 RepID=A0AC59ZW91_RANTA
MYQTVGCHASSAPLGSNHKVLLTTPTLTPHKGGSSTSLRGPLHQGPPAPSAELCHSKRHMLRFLGESASPLWRFDAVHALVPAAPFRGQPQPERLGLSAAHGHLIGFCPSALTNGACWNIPVPRLERSALVTEARRC